MALEVRGSMAQGEEAGVLEVMQQQWASMLSMGGMFVGTILLILLGHFHGIAGIT